MFSLIEADSGVEGEAETEWWNNSEEAATFASQDGQCYILAACREAEVVSVSAEFICGG